MALIELRMTRKNGLVVIVRFHSLQNSILLVCGLRWMHWKKQSRCLPRIQWLGLGRRIPWTSCLQTSNLQGLRSTWTSGVARRRRRRWLLSRLVPYSTVVPARPIPTCRQVYILCWRTPRMRWAGVEETQIIISWYGSQHARTAVSPERGDTGDWKDYRLRHLDRRREFKQKEKYFDKYGNGCRHLFNSCNPGIPQTRDIQRR